MFLKKSHNKKTGRTQLSIVQGYRADGKVRHKTIQNLGFLDELEKNTMILLLILKRLLKNSIILLKTGRSRLILLKNFRKLQITERISDMPQSNPYTVCLACMTFFNISNGL